MKLWRVLLTVLSSATFALGQGQFIFNNQIGTEVNARFIVCPPDPPDGSSSSVGSPDWSVQLLGGPVGGTLAPLAPPITTFLGATGTAEAGYVVGTTPTVPGVAPGGTAQVLVRLLGPNGLSQDFGPYTVSNLGRSGSGTLPNLQLGTVPIGSGWVICLPEPSTGVLAWLEMVAVFWASKVRVVRSPTKHEP